MYPGFQIGGPVILPHSDFNRNRDKMFFISSEPNITNKTSTTVSTMQSSRPRLCGKVTSRRTSLTLLMVKSKPYTSFFEWLRRLLASRMVAE